ncbi:MAG: lipopolysaccharide kinase InaA family protein [Gemmatimonadota bacterium]
MERGRAHALVRPAAKSWVRYVLESGETLYTAASKDRKASRLEGRRPVFVIPAKIPAAWDNGEDSSGSAVSWAVRHFVRGGKIVSALLEDRYFRIGALRPYHEIRASEEARTRGIPTPLVVAAATYFDGPFYRADMVTEFIREASDLVEALFDDRRKGAGGAAERLDALQASGALVRQLARAGLRHRDLHAGNILLQWKGAAPRAYLLDLDRCDIGPAGRPINPVPMQQRLKRSLSKWERLTGLRVSEREWKTLDRAVAG